MKRSIRNGGIVECDMVHVRETSSDVIFENPCQEKFTTYSFASLARAQAAFVGWVRVRCGRVTWPGTPPMENKKKVDLCPLHAGLVTVKAPKAPKPRLEVVK